MKFYTILMLISVLLVTAVFAKPDLEGLPSGTDETGRTSVSESEPVIPDFPTEAPTETETEAPTEIETEASTEPETEAPTESETEAPTEPETEAPPVPETQPPVPETQPPVPETQPPVVAPPAPVRVYPPLSPYASADELRIRALQLHADKAVYITFDDGPSPLTPYLLDMLDWYGVKATFFVVYRPEMEWLYREILARGHAIGLHCTYHAYDSLYASFESWKRDFDNLYYYLTQVIGYTPHLYRFPGGSIWKLGWKQQALDYMASLGVVWWDWNVIMEGGDANTPREEILANAADGFRRNLPVILCHDGMGMDLTVSCVPDVLQMYLERGYTFRVLDASVPPIRQGNAYHWDYY